MFQDAFGSFGTPFYEGAVIFAEALGLELAAEFPCGEGGPGEDEESGHGLVQTVDDGEIGLSFGAGGLMDVVLEEIYHVGEACFPALGGNAVGFDAYYDIIVFI